MIRYAHIIQQSQHDLGLEVDSFDNIGMSAASFLWEVVQQKEDNNNQEQHVAEEEKYLTELTMNERDSLIHIMNIFKMMRIKGQVD